MDYKQKIVEVSKGNWGGLPYHDLKRELLRVYTLLDFFMTRTINDYLNQNEKTILKSIKEDKVPKEVLAELFEYEEANKKRPKVLELLNDLRR